MQIKYLLLAAISGAVITLDQATKMYVHTRFELHESIDVIQGFFNLTYVRNYGAAFGLGSGAHPEFREVFFLAVPPIALVIIFLILRQVADSDRWGILSLSLIFGGAIGNYIDRLRFRYVIDFFDFHWRGQYSYPAFNIADIAIVSGIALLIYLEFSRPYRDKGADSDAQAQSQ